jgi:hypothetical protein
MGLSARNRRKHMAKAMALVPQDGARPLDYALGGAGSLPPALLRWTIFGGWIAVTLVLSVLLKTFVAVGFLPMLGLFFLLNKPRGVLLSDRGLASLRCGFLNGRPTDLLGLGPLISLDQRLETKAENTKLQIGDDAVWLTHKDLARFLQVAPGPGRAASPPQS